MSEPRNQASVTFAEGEVVTRIVAPMTLLERYDKGVAAAATLAERFGLPLLLVNVDLGPDDAIRLDRGEAMKAAFAALGASHPALDLDELMLAATDDPTSVFAAALAPGDLVVLATSAVEGAPGSFAQQLASRSNAPLLMIGPNAELGSLSGDVLVAVDGSILAERILPAALGIAAAIGSNVKLVEVVPSAVSDHVARLKERGEKVSENAYIRDLCDRLDDAHVSWEVIHADDPGLALSDAAGRAKAAIIAMATHGRGGFVAQVFGSITLETVRNARCPVLVQRPVSAEIAGELLAR